MKPINSNSLKFIQARPRLASAVAAGLLAGLLAGLPFAALAADINIISNYSGAASGLDPVNVPGGNWGSNTLHLGNPVTGKTIEITSGTLQGTNSNARSFEVNGISNIITFTGSSTAVIVASSRNWSTGSVKIYGTTNTMNVSAGAHFTANGWNGFEGSNNVINVTDAGSVATFSADQNDGFGNSNSNPSTSTGCRLNIVAGGAVYVNSGVHTFTSSTAGTYAINVDGSLGRSVFGTRFFGDYTSAPAGGVLRAFNGGALELLGGGTTWSTNGGPYNRIRIDGGVLSYQGSTGVNMGESLSADGVSQFTWANATYGGNALRLNAATASDTGSYTLSNSLDAKNYTRLEMINGTTSVARDIVIDGGNGGSILFDNTSASIANGVTLSGAAATLTATGSPSTLTGEVKGDALVKTGSGRLTLATAPTYSGNTTIEEGTLGVSSPNFNAASTLTIGSQPGSSAVLDLPNSGTHSVAVLIIGGVTMANGLYGSGNSGGAISGSGQILVGAVIPGYATWASAFASPPLSNTAADADPDGDGLSNAVGYVLGRDPRYSNSGGPSSSIVGSNLIFTFNRAKSSATPDVALKVRVSTDLADWTSIPGYTIGATTATSTTPGVEVNAAGPNNTDLITVTIPMAPDVKKFARLAVTVAP